MTQLTRGGSAAEFCGMTRRSANDFARLEVTKRNDLNCKRCGSNVLNSWRIRHCDTSTHLGNPLFTPRLHVYIMLVICSTVPSIQRYPPGIPVGCNPSVRISSLDWIQWVQLLLDWIQWIYRPMAAVTSGRQVTTAGCAGWSHGRDPVLPAAGAVAALAATLVERELGPPPRRTAEADAARHGAR